MKIASLLQTDFSQAIEKRFNVADLAFPDGSTQPTPSATTSPTTSPTVTSSATAVPPPTPPTGSQRLAFGFVTANNYQIYLKNADGSNTTQLTTQGANFLPRFSRDGQKIVFSSFRDGNEEIYSMNADASQQRRLTVNASTDTEPEFSPDGTQIVFRSNRSGNSQIWTMSASGQNLKQLTQAQGDVRWPRWAPNGQSIAYTVNSQVMLTNVSTGNSRTLTSGLYPSFSPDSNSILFTTTNGVTSLDLSSMQVNVVIPNGSNTIVIDPLYDPTKQFIAYVTTPSSGVSFLQAKLHIFSISARRDTLVFDGYEPSWAPGSAPSATNGTSFDYGSGSGSFRTQSSGVTSRRKR